jgi:serine protease Do
VVPDDPADKAGIKVKDIILSVNGIKAVDSFRFRSYIATLKPAETAKFTLWRDGREITLSVTLGDRAAAVAREKDNSRSSDYAQREPEGMVPIPLFPDPLGEPSQEEPPKLGITVQPLNSSLAREYGYDKNLHGFVISGVSPGSVAQQSGLKTGDIIVSVNGVRIETGDQLKEIIQKADLTTEGVKIIVRNQTGQRTIIAKRQDPGQ